jgi:hypothetical protein
VRGLISGFEVIVIALGHDFVLQQKLGAIELTIGTRYLDFCLTVIGSCRSNLTALDEADGLPLGHFLSGPNIQFDQATGDLRVDMDHARRVGFNPRSEDQTISHGLRMNGSDFDRGFLGSIFAPGRGWRFVIAAKADEKEKDSYPRWEPGHEPG